MLKVELNGNERIVNVKAEGTLPELMADVTTLLNVMYDNVKEEQKEDFKKGIKMLAEEELYTKTSKELDELTKKQKEKVKEKLKKELEDFLKDLFGGK